MTTIELYDLAEQNQILVINLEMEEVLSASACYNGNYAIVMDKSQIETGRQEKVCILHEMGHCETGSFYNIYSPLDLQEKHEYQANKWAIHKAIPLDELQFALENGCTEMWELAEEFGVTEDFVKKSLEIYETEGLYTPPQSEL